MLMLLQLRGSAQQWRRQGARSASDECFGFSFRTVQFLPASNLAPMADEVPEGDGELGWPCPAGGDAIRESYQKVGDVAIGRGAFAEVWKIKCIQEGPCKGKTVAAKIINLAKVNSSFEDIRVRCVNAIAALLPPRRAACSAARAATLAGSLAATAAALPAAVDLLQ